MKKRILEYVCTHWVYDFDDIEDVIRWIGFQDHLDCLEQNRQELLEEIDALKSKIKTLAALIEAKDEKPVQKKKRHYNKNKNKQS